MPRSAMPRVETCHAAFLRTPMPCVIWPLATPRHRKVAYWLAYAHGDGTIEVVEIVEPLIEPQAFPEPNLLRGFRVRRQADQRPDTRLEEWSVPAMRAAFRRGELLIAF